MGDVWSKIRKLWKKYFGWAVVIITALVVVIYVYCAWKFHLTEGPEKYREIVCAFDDIGIVFGFIAFIVSLVTFANTRRILGEDKNPYVDVEADKNSAVIIFDIGLGIKDAVSSYIWNHSDKFQDILCDSKDDLRNSSDVIGLKSQNALNRDKTFQFEYGISKNVPGAKDMCLGNGRVITVSSKSIPEDEQGFQNAVDDLYDTLGDLRKMLHADGVKHIFVFYAGLTALPFYIGEYFSNSITTEIYHYATKKGDYLYGGVMNKNSRGNR